MTRCKHCGQEIYRSMENGMWRHTESKLYTCTEDQLSPNPTFATPEEYYA